MIERAGILAIEDPAERLHEFVSGYHATQYVSVGVSCGLFEALSSPRTAGTLAADLDLHEPYVQVFCEVGLRWGLLEAVDAPDGRIERGGTLEDVRFRLREEFEALLGRPDAVQYMGDLFRLAAVHQGEDYRRYPEWFRTGGGRSFAAHDEAFSATVERSTRGLQTIFVAKVVPESLPRFASLLEDGPRLLDVGCGGGHLLRTLAERYPGVAGVGIDLDEDAIDRARAAAEEAGLDDRLTFRVADASSYEPGAPIDAAISFVSLHEIPPADRKAVMENVGDLLDPDGLLVVFDEVYPDDLASFQAPPYTNAVESQWAEVTWGNRIPTVHEQRDLLAVAGLTETARTTFVDRFVAFEAAASPE